MYTLRVYHGDDRQPTKVVFAASAADVFALIPELLAEYDGCERIAVLMGTVFLFSVDCHGQRMDRDQP
jgi:hypothetical protein